MIEPFDLNLYQRALLATLIIGFTNGYASAFVLLNRSPLKLSALSHSLLPGVALAALLVGLSMASAFIGAVLTALLVGLLTIFLSQRGKVGQDTTLAVLYTGAFSLGILILKRINATQELEHWLLGNIMGLADSDLWMGLGVGVLAVGVFSILRRPLLLNLFEPDVAKTLGVKSNLLNYGIFALLILVLVTTLQAVGCILAIGLIVTPAATVRQFVNSAGALFWWSGLVGALGSALGLYLSYQLDLPPGASIVLVHSLLFLLSMAVSILKPKPAE